MREAVATVQHCSIAAHSVNEPQFCRSLVCETDCGDWPDVSRTAISRGPYTKNSNPEIDAVPERKPAAEAAESALATCCGGTGRQGAACTWVTREDSPPGGTKKASEQAEELHTEPPITDAEAGEAGNQVSVSDSKGEAKCAQAGQGLNGFQASAEIFWSTAVAGAGTEDVGKEIAVVQPFLGGGLEENGRSSLDVGTSELGVEAYHAEVVGWGYKELGGERPAGENCHEDGKGGQMVAVQAQAEVTRTGLKE